MNTEGVVTRTIRDTAGLLDAIIDRRPGGPWPPPPLPGPLSAEVGRGTADVVVVLPFYWLRCVCSRCDAGYRRVIEKFLDFPAHVDAHGPAAAQYIISPSASVRSSSNARSGSWLRGTARLSGGVPGHEVGDVRIRRGAHGSRLTTLKSSGYCALPG